MLQWLLHQQIEDCTSNFLGISWSIKAELINIIFIIYRVTQALSHILTGLQIVNTFRAILETMSCCIVSECDILWNGKDKFTFSITILYDITQAISFTVLPNQCPFTTLQLHMFLAAVMLLIYGTFKEQFSSYLTKKWCLPICFSYLYFVKMLMTTFKLICEIYG